MNYSETILSLLNSMIENFDYVYHSAEIVVNDKAERFPAIAKEDEWIPLAPTDQRETLYIRRNGDDEVFEELKLSPCMKSYRMRTLMRVVFFKDHVKNHSEILSKLMQSVLVSGTKLKAIRQDKWKLLKEESSGDYNFGGTTAYFALDIYVNWELIPSSCVEDFCVDIVNPIKK